MVANQIGLAKRRKQDPQPAEVEQEEEKPDTPRPQEQKGKGRRWGFKGPGTQYENESRAAL